MNTDILKGAWTQLKGQARKQWGRLTDDELDQEGDRDMLAGKIQQRYGWARDRVEREITQFLERNRPTADRPGAQRGRPQESADR